QAGGTNHPDNLTTLCSSCHRLRHEPSTVIMNPVRV
ncbi:hypothetical protein DRQ50_09345, partial [bacterium]